MTWEGSTNTPGWENVTQYAEAISITHGGSVEIGMAMDGLGSQRLSVWVTWSRAGMTPAGPGTLKTSVLACFPTVGHHSMTGLVLALLFQLDYEVGSSYMQAPLPLEE